jgi:hypothetical protein
MLVKICSYDPVKGLGWYETPKGERHKFRYNHLLDQEIIPPGDLANLRKGKYLDPVYSKFGRIKWLLQRLTS